MPILHNIEFVAGHSAHLLRVKRPALSVDLYYDRRANIQVGRDFPVSTLNIFYSNDTEYFKANLIYLKGQGFTKNALSGQVTFTLCCARSLPTRHHLYRQSVNASFTAAREQWLQTPLEDALVCRSKPMSFGLSLRYLRGTGDYCLEASRTYFFGGIYYIYNAPSMLEKDLESQRLLTAGQTLRLNKTERFLNMYASPSLSRAIGVL